MITRLLRRLQGRPAAADTPSAAPTPDAGREPGATVALDADALAVPFVRHLLDVPVDITVEPGAAGEIASRLDGMVERLDVSRLPRLPALVPQLLAAMRRDDVDANALAALVGRDPTLAGEVVRVANSAHYRRGAVVSSLPQAIGTIGHAGLRYVVLRTVTRPILCADPSHQGARSGERLAAHADARTWLCGTLAPGVCDPGEAQLASVIASTGVAALLRMMPRPLLVQAASDDAFAPRFLRIGAEISARAATHWRLGDTVRDALAAMPGADAAAPPLHRMLADADRMAMLYVLRGAGLTDDELGVTGAAAPPVAALLDTLASLDAAA